MNRYFVIIFNQENQLLYSDAPNPLLHQIQEKISQKNPSFYLTVEDILYQVEKQSDSNIILYKIQSIPKDLETPKVFEMLLAAIEQSYEGVIMTDNNGRVVYMNENYARFLNVSKIESIGKHVTEVIQNTRMHIVAESKKAEIGVVWKHNNKALIVSRFPFFKNGQVLGTIGFIMFQTTLELRDLLKKIEDMEKKLEYYKSNIFPTHQVKYNFEDIYTKSPIMLDTIEKAKKIASTPSNIVITGESGTGKELFAHSIHHYSYRKDGPFITVNCSAIPNELFESELFGYVEGAFTGAKKGGKPGKFELANNGTIFLDEVGEIPMPIQAKLLRVIQERELEKIGGSRPIHVDVRIIAATNKNLQHLIEKNQFREDLYYRLNVFHLNLPPLRSRKEDIEGSILFFLKNIEKETGKHIEIEKEAIDMMKSYSWPGNLRELKNLIEMLTGIMEGNIIKKEHIPVYFIGHENEPSHHFQNNPLNPNHLNYKNCIQNLEKELILCALKQTHGQKKDAAKILGIARSLLYKKMKEYGIQEEKTFSLM